MVNAFDIMCGKERGTTKLEEVRLDKGDSDISVCGMVSQVTSVPVFNVCKNSAVLTYPSAGTKG